MQTTIRDQSTGPEKIRGLDQATPKQWHILYALANEFNALAHRQWMAETDLFGIEDPEAGTVACVSAMGEGGVHCGVAAYLGTRGLHGFFRLLAGAGGPEDLLQVPRMVASFADRADLWRRDLAVIKKAGIRFRGRGQWPLLRIFTRLAAPAKTGSVSMAEFVALGLLLPTFRGGEQDQGIAIV